VRPGSWTAPWNAWPPRQRAPRPGGDVVTNYDAIAHVCRESKRLPIKQYSEGFTLFQVLESVRGLAALDVACGG
jgi:hypothetical protein